MKEMHAKLVIFVAVSALLVVSIYSISSSIVFALIKRSSDACIKVTKNGVTTETCCHNETNTDTGKKTQYCTECKTLQDGTEMPCTHTQNDLTKTSMVQGVGPSNAPQSTKGENNTHITNGNIVKSGSALKSGIGEVNPSQPKSNDTLQ
jgi:hypothetical protein